MQMATKAAIVTAMGLSMLPTWANAKGPYPMDVLRFVAVAATAGAWCSALDPNGSGRFGPCAEVCRDERIGERPYAPGRGLWCHAPAAPELNDEIAGLRVVENDG